MKVFWVNVNGTFKICVLNSFYKKESILQFLSIWIYSRFVSYDPNLPNVPLN